MKHPAYPWRMSDMIDDKTHLDARGLLCPLPVLKTRKRLQALAVGEVLTVWADDPAAVIDMPHFCAESGHVLVSQSEAQGLLTFKVKKS